MSCCDRGDCAYCRGEMSYGEDSNWYSRELQAKLDRCERELSTLKTQRTQLINDLKNETRITADLINKCEEARIKIKSFIELCGTLTDERDQLRSERDQLLAERDELHNQLASKDNAPKRKRRKTR